MIERLKQNAMLKLFSLLLGIALWLNVQLGKPQVAQQTFVFNLERLNLDDQNLVVTNMTESNVKIQASGPPEELRKLKGKDYTAFVDLSNAEVGLKEYAVKVNYPTEGKVDWERPPMVFVNIESLAHDYKRVMVVQDDSLSPAGFALGDPTVEPEMVTVEGPQSRVKQVVQCRALLMSTDRVKPGMEVRVPIEVLDKSGKVVPQVTADPKEVVVRPTLVPLLPRHNVLVVPSWKGQPAFGYRVKSYTISPNQLELTGDHKKLSKVSTVDTEPINLDGLRDSKVIEVFAVLPSGSGSKNGRKIVVRVVIEKEPVASPKPLGTPDL